MRLFKKKKTIRNRDKYLFEKIATELPEQYSFLSLQLQGDFIVDFKPNPALGNSWQRLVLDKGGYEKFVNEQVNYKLTDINVINQKTGGKTIVDFDLYVGVIIGVRIVGDDFSDGDDLVIDFSGVKKVDYESPSQEVDEEKALFKLATEILPQLEKNSSFSVEVGGYEIFVVSEKIGFIAVFNEGAVFGVKASSFEVRKIFDTQDKFFEAVDKGNFDVETFFSSW